MANEPGVESERRGSTILITLHNEAAFNALVAALAPAAVEMTKEVMSANLHAASLDHALALESRSQAMTRTTADAEARRAFLDKRAPSFPVPTTPREVR